MKQVNNITESRSQLGAGLTRIAHIDTAGLDVLMLDIANAGASPFTAFEVFASVSDSAPTRSVTPGSWSSENSFVWRPASVNLAALASGNGSHLGLNVSAFDRIEIFASGSGATAVLSGSGYEVRA